MRDELWDEHEEADATMGKVYKEIKEKIKEIRDVYQVHIVHLQDEIDRLESELKKTR